MIWNICFIAALAVLVATVISAVAYHRSHAGAGTLYLLTFGIAVSAVAILYPLSLSQLEGGYLRAVLLAVHNTLRLFVLDDDFSLMIEKTEVLGRGFRVIYGVLAAIIYLAAPVMTFSVVLSFLRKYAAYRNYLLHYTRPAYIFSELNERSIALATDLKRDKPRCVIAFTGVGDDDDGYSKRLAGIGALQFHDGVDDVNFARHSRRAEMTFFIISDDDAQNIRESLSLIERYRGRTGTRMYVFSDSVSGRLMLENADCGEMVVQRVNEAQRTVASLLYERGGELFDSAVPIPGSDERQITAVVAGLDGYGLEMVRALPWLCQMTGYRISIHVISARDDAEELLRSMCPELLDDGHNGLSGTDEDACYSISVYPDVREDGARFDRIIEAIPDISFAFVSLGNDERNIKTAAKLRMLAERARVRGCTADEGRTDAKIWAVVRSGDDMQTCRDADLCNHRGQKYGISFVGGISAVCSVDGLLFSKLEEMALARHRNWGDEKSFWRVEYNYRSSIASVIHARYKKYCRVPGADIPNPNDRPPEARELLRRLEHRRWNAYMRSEGYVFCEKRDELARTHHCLVPFSSLSEEEQRKDDD